MWVFVRRVFVWCRRRDWALACETRFKSEWDEIVCGERKNRLRKDSTARRKGRLKKGRLGDKRKRYVLERMGV